MKFNKLFLIGLAPLLLLSACGKEAPSSSGGTPGGNTPATPDATPTPSGGDPDNSMLSNAFKEMGGNMSFALAELDYTNSGFIINTVHSREGCYLYIKTVDCGQTEVLLSAEEKEALEKALGYLDR